MILVVSYPGDDHTAAVVELLLGDGREVVLLDAGSLGSTSSLELGYDRSGPTAHLVSEAGEFDLSTASSGWWRRLRTIEADPSIVDPAALGFVHSETAEVFDGVVASLDASWINPPAADARAHHKPLQWSVASTVGLGLPRTIVTRSPERARAFVDELGTTGVITKAFLARADAWRETHRLEASDVERLDQVRFAPTILQEYVPGVDLRVTMIDGEAYAAEIDATGTSLPSDMRMVLDEADVQATVLPDGVVAALRHLMAELGLVYGAIDLRRTPDGEYVFFEVNPAGLWLFAEELTGLPITAALADALRRRDRDPSQMRARAPRDMVVA
ncbi:MvdC/MvdD family ATP grasp protein [Agromyces allii]|uniref:ATP-grasp domain-containing protein n=1 Tax=Agromyces allii TaxID=393607 RepID=A0ABN2QWY1_9MICO|nr:alpha-L-glutamate ligase [Agromyces allii]